MKAFRFLGALALSMCLHATFACEFTCPSSENLQCSIDESPIFSNYSAFEAAGGVAGNCELDVASFTIASQISDGASCPEIITRVYRIQDTDSNVFTCDHILWIEDDIPPILLCPSNNSIICDIAEDPPYFDLIDFEISGGYSDDDCGINASSFFLISEVSDNLTCPETISRTYQIEDFCGNRSFCDHLIVINDNEGPSINCPPSINGSENIDNYPSYSNFSEFENEGGNAMDNCELNYSSFLLLNEVLVDDVNPKKYIRTYEIEDLCNNTNSCQQSIFICIATDTTLQISECESYTSPNGNYNWSASGIYKDTIPNVAMCDSVITINLTIEDEIVEQSEDGLPNSLRMSLACASFLNEIRIANTVDTIKLMEPLIITDDIIIIGDEANLPVLEFDFLNAELMNAAYGMKIESGKTIDLENIILKDKNNINGIDLLRNKGILTIRKTVKIK